MLQDEVTSIFNSIENLGYEGTGLIFAYKLMINGEHFNVNDNKELEIKNIPYEKLSIPPLKNGISPERMYPPIRNIDVYSKLIENEAYGNGIYSVAFSSSRGPSTRAYYLFNENGNGQWAHDRYNTTDRYFNTDFNEFTLGNL